MRINKPYKELYMQKLILSALGVALVAHVASAADDYNVTWRGNVGTSIATPANWAHDWNAVHCLAGGGIDVW